MSNNIHFLTNCIALRRKKLGLSQTQLSELSGISRNSISEIESGSGVSLINAFRIANALDTSVEDLFKLWELPYEVRDDLVGGDF